MATANEKNTSPTKREVEAEKQDQVADVETVTFTVDLRGRDFEVTAPVDILDADPDAYLAWEENRFAALVKALLGDTQWAFLRRTGMRGSDIKDVWSAYAEAISGAGED